MKLPHTIACNIAGALLGWFVIAPALQPATTPVIDLYPQGPFSGLYVFEGRVFFGHCGLLDRMDWEQRVCISPPRRPGVVVGIGEPKVTADGIGTCDHGQLLTYLDSKWQCAVEVPIP